MCRNSSPFPKRPQWMLLLGEGLVCRVGERLKQLPGTAVGLGEESRLNSTHQAAAGNRGANCDRETGVRMGGRWREGLSLIKLSVATQLCTTSPSNRKLTWSHLFRKLWSLGICSSLNLFLIKMKLKENKKDGCLYVSS